jgi:hypothetical protein
MKASHWTKASFNHPVSLIYFSAILILVFCTLVGAFINLRWEPPSPPFLESLHTAEITVQLILSFFLFAQDRFEKENRHFKLAGTAILFIALLTWPRSLLPAEFNVPALFWSRTIGYFAAAALLNLVWLPPSSPVKAFVLRRLPWILTLLTIGFMISLIAFNDFIPPAPNRMVTLRWASEFSIFSTGS